MKVWIYLRASNVDYFIYIQVEQWVSVYNYLSVVPQSNGFQYFKREFRPITDRSHGINRGGGGIKYYGFIRIDFSVLQNAYSKVW